jgi:hypothetical protein
MSGVTTLRLRYPMAEYCSGGELKIDDKVYLAPTRPYFGGLRWWFLCPHRAQAVPAARRPSSGFGDKQAFTGLTQAVIRKHSRDLPMGITDRATEAWYHPSIA